MGGKQLRENIMNINIEIRILTTSERLTTARELSNTLPNSELFIDENLFGAKWNHMRALSSPPQEGTTHIIIMEDDAQPVEDFLTKASEWLEVFPKDLISFYLGKGKPALWQRKVDYALMRRPSYIELEALIHGVCYVIPAQAYELFAIDTLTDTAELAVGELWTTTTERTIIYTTKSLVQHTGNPNKSARYLHTN